MENNKLVNCSSKKLHYCDCQEALVTVTYVVCWNISLHCSSPLPSIVFGCSKESCIFPYAYVRVRGVSAWRDFLLPLARTLSYGKSMSNLGYVFHTFPQISFEIFQRRVRADLHVGVHEDLSLKVIKHFNFNFSTNPFISFRGILHV